MNKVKYKKGDLVLIMSGKDGGKTGKISSVNRVAGKAVVEGMNVFKKNAKPSNKYPQGGIIEISKPVDLSNLGIICPSCKKKSKVSIVRVKGSVSRKCRKCNEVVDVK